MSNRAYRISPEGVAKCPSFNFASHYALIDALAERMELDGGDMARIEWGGEVWSIPVDVLAETVRAISLEEAVGQCLGADIKAAQDAGETCVRYQIA